MTALATNREVLSGAAEYFTEARKSIIEGAKLLHMISKSELWKGEYESFSQYVEEECKISRGYASKLVEIWEHYVVGGGVSPRNLEGVDSEMLYKASKLKGTPMKQLAAAQTLKRSQLRAEIKDPDDECKHPETYTICSSCHKRL